MTQHRIEFVQLMHAARNLFDRNAEFVGQLILLSVIVRQRRRA